MRLYQDAHAPNPRRVRMFAAEKGLSDRLELVDVSINDSTNRSEAHLARNPLGKVPVLELDDGRVLRESMAICRYLDELHPEPALFGTDPWQRAVIEQWNRHAELEILFPIGEVFRNGHPFWKDRIRQAPEYADIMRALVHERMTWLDRELADRRYLAGDQFSVADITLLCGIDFARVVKIRIGDQLPDLARWRGEVAARPSAAA